MIDGIGGNGINLKFAKKEAEMITVNRKKYPTLVAFAMLITFLCQSVAGVEPLAVTKIDHNGSSSCRRPHNAGLYDSGRTFVCWAGPQMAPCIKMYDHENETWSHTAIIHTYRSHDYHDYPTIVLSSDKHLHIFWTRHNREIYHSRSPEPLGIEGTWTHQVIKKAGATYPCPMTGPNGELYLFYRGRGNPTRSHADYLKSTDTGKTWRGVKDAISNPYKGKTRGFYLQHVTRETARDVRALSYQLAWSLRTSPKSPLVNVYFVRFYPGRDVFESVDGTDLGKSISQEDAKNHCLVKETTAAGWGLLSEAQENGHVIVFYGHWKKPGRVCARWTGKEWEETVVPFSVREIEYLGANATRIYGRGKNGLVWRESRDSGKTWKQAGSLALPGKRFAQCILIDDFHPDVRLFIKNDDQWNPKNYDGTDKILVVGQKETGGGEDAGK